MAYQTMLAYLTYLVKELVDQMLTVVFQIQLLVNLNTKSEQLTSFQEVRYSNSI